MTERQPDAELPDVATPVPDSLPAELITVDPGLLGDSVRGSGAPTTSNESVPPSPGEQE
jgi:hypothetical protein